MKNYCLLLISVLCVSNSALAALVVTEKGINNIGSMTAYVMNCEAGKYIKLGTTSDYIIRIRKTFSKPDADAIMLAYQNALHSKKIYSPSKNKWFDMQINRKSCEDVESALPTLDDFFRKMANEYPN